jgi:hypothetical protein
MEMLDITQSMCQFLEILVVMQKRQNVCVFFNEGAA